MSDVVESVVESDVVTSNVDTNMCRRATLKMFIGKIFCFLDLHCRDLVQMKIFILQRE